MRSTLLALIFACSAMAATPYRFLLVAGNQWEDDASFLIDRPSEFQITAALLKSWGLPFDVMRLDQQLLDRYHLLDRDGRPRYGTIIWNAPEIKGRDISLLADLNAQGVSVVILGDTIKTPEIARLAGLRYVSDYKAYDDANFDPGHFITRPLVGREKELLANVGFSYEGIKVVPERAKVIGRRGAAPFVTVSEEAGRGRVAWLGVERTVAQFQNQLVRDLLKRSLVWAQGYAVYAEYDRAVILFMDDWGTSDKTYLPYWHYKTPTEDEIRKGLIEPLQKYHAVMDMNVDTGYVDRKTRRIVNPWQQRVVDEIDGKTIHDFASTKRGLDAGLAAGVFSIESHGWTHMLPDLESPPGPFWDAPMDGVGSLDWYNEFGDALRKHEIPAATQRLHLSRTIEYIREDFGVVPQVVRPGGSLYSKSPANNTAVIAARMGFGLATWDWAVYLGKDLAVSLEAVSRRKAWAYNQRIAATEIPWTVDAPAWLGFHDRDLSLDHASVARLLDGLGGGIRYMNGDEYSAYLHANAGRVLDGGLRFGVDYDGNYCRWFASHPSRWTVHLSDDTRRSLEGSVPEKQTIEVPKGLGTHVLWSGKRHAETGNPAP
jgi:peptidoglycan/xylan/chitin deacetylase (PgdA/CDA1 family)